MKCPDCHFQHCDTPERGLCCRCSWDRKEGIAPFKPCGECWLEMDGEDKITLALEDSAYAWSD